MKKRGSVLATVLIIGSVLLILGTSISAAVINTIKLNKKYSENIDLELAAKSGLNIVLSDFFNIAKTEEAINSFVVNKPYIDSIYEEGTGIEVNVSFVIESNQITFTSLATDRKNVSNVKEETRVVKLNLNDTGSDVVELKPNKFINVTNDVYIYELTENINSKLEFGGNMYTDRNSVSIPESNTSLSKVGFDLNTTNINKFKIEHAISDFEKNEYDASEINLISLSPNSDYNTININLDSENRIIEGGIDGQGKEIYIKLNNSVLVIDGSVYNNRKLDITATGNSKVLVRGYVECNAGETTMNLTSSYMDIQKYIKSSGHLNITLNTSQLNVNDKASDSVNSIQSTGNAVNLNVYENSMIYSQYGIQANNDLKINLKDNSKLITKAGDLKSSYIEVNLSESNLVKSDASLVKINGDVVSGTTNRINLYNENKFNITGKLESKGNDTFIILKNNSSFNVNDINAESAIDIELNNSNMISGNLSCERSKVDIELNNSKLIQGAIKGNSVSIKPVINSTLITQGSINSDNHNIEIESKNSPIFINGLISSNSFNTTLTNSIFVLDGDMRRVNLPDKNYEIDSITFTNSDKSFVYIIGDVRARALNLHSADNIMPDQSIIDSFKEFVNF